MIPRRFIPVAGEMLRTSSSQIPLKPSLRRAGASNVYPMDTRARALSLVKPIAISVLGPAGRPLAFPPLPSLSRLEEVLLRPG